MFQGEREQKHAKRAAPTGANFLLVRKFSKEDAFTFFSLLRKEPKVAEGPRPSRLPGTVQIAGRNDGFDRITSFHHVTIYE